MQLENSRLIEDANFIASIALPAAGSTTVDTPSLNLVQVFAMSESYDVVVEVDPLATLGAGNTLSVALQSAPDNATWASIPGLAAQVITGNTTETTYLVWRLPKAANPYLRATATTGAAITSTLAGSNATLKIKF